MFAGGSQAGLSYASGDGTVPLLSARQQPRGAAKPLGDAVRISYLCGIDHIGLIQKAKVFELMGDFIRYGSPPRQTRSCDFSGFEYSIQNVGGTRASATAAAQDR